MARYLITQSLLHSWNYLYSCREEFQSSAAEDFMATIHREKQQDRKEKNDGIEFENAVYQEVSDIQRDPHPKWEDGIQAIAKIIHGASVQLRVQRDLRVCETDFLVYGILDALKAGVIYDVKYKRSPFSSSDPVGDYLDSPQHPAYFYMVPEAYEFQYLVSDGKDLYRETYRRSETPAIEGIIAEFMRSITAMGLLPIYQEKWLAR